MWKISQRIREQVEANRLTGAELERFDTFLDSCNRELMTRPVITDNRYCCWFSRGKASREDVTHLIVQFSVFSNLFLIAEGASFAVENWAAAGFRKDLIAGLDAFKKSEENDMPPACAEIIHDFDQYRYRYPKQRSEETEQKEAPLKVDDHGPDMVRYMLDGRAEYYGEIEDAVVGGEREALGL